LRTIILVPVMYSEADLKELLGAVPPDFADESKQFWNYVQAKLAVMSGRVSMVCLLWNEGTVDPRASAVAESLNKDQRIRRLADSTLVGEVRAWYNMSREEGDEGSGELCEECNRELSRILGEILGTLADSEVAVVFADPACRLVLADDFRVIRMTPFDPHDYVQRHRVHLRLTGKV